VAAGSLRFFRTGPGEYGHGDRFLGVRVPVVRREARALRELGLATLEQLLGSEWHEVRLLAVILLGHRYARVSAERDAIYSMYLRLAASRVNNWDLVDSSAPHVVGRHLFERSRAPLFRLARSKSLWERRIAIIATQWFIRKGDVADTFRLAEVLLGDEHDLIHKAVGWMLREAGQRDLEALYRFLEQHAGDMPRTMLRYALEKVPARRRALYMQRERVDTRA
jgi:3-methyladenine DNA glycosylase AlkD